MDTLDLDILTFMSERENWDTYGSVIEKGLCTKLSWQLVNDFATYYKEHESATVIDKDFSLWLRLKQRPTMSEDEKEMIGAILKNVEDKRENDPLTPVFVSTLREAKVKSKIDHLTDDLTNGRMDLAEYLEEIQSIKPVGASHDDDGDVNLTLIDIANEVKTSSGLYWRLEDMNKAVGPIRQGDLCIIGKRPETGGTSFLCSESTFMFEQMDKDILIVNNEETPRKIITRLMSCALDVDYRHLITKPHDYQADWEKWLGGRQIVLKHKIDASMSDINRWVDEGDYGLVGVNVLLKVVAPGKLEDHDKLQYIGTGLRQIASDVCPVLGIHQADPTADGVKYIHQDKLYKSKTALQGEADILLMIGYDYDEPHDSRFIHVAKNKLPPAACCDPSLAHAMTEVHFNTQTGRFTSKLFKGAHSCQSK